MENVVILDYSSPGAPGEREGKFLQLVLGGREYLLFASGEPYRYHNQILARFLAERGVPHRWATSERLEIDGPGPTVVGGGRFRSDATGRVLELWDDSHAYGRFDERGLAEKIAAAGHAWSGYRVAIRPLPTLDKAGGKD